MIASTLDRTAPVPAQQAISGVPYLPGLDGLRALAVVVVMVYHANARGSPAGSWASRCSSSSSGYLITLLLIGEHERTGARALGRLLVAPGPPPAAALVRRSCSA